MKLRNKKTGKIWDMPHYKEITMGDGKVKYTYKSLAEVNENWEDYQPSEPLIKDPKIRKAVRAWAEANGYTKLWVYHDHTTISFYNKDDGDNEITFNTMEKFGLENLKCYTIAELCGEEEE